MTNLGDDAEAFFRSGDEGTYEGGPASSIAPFVFEEPAADWDLRSADDWLERRRRLKRFVVTVVGGLSAGLVILSMCLLGARARGADGATRSRQAAPAAQLPVAAATGVTVQLERQVSPSEATAPALVPVANDTPEPAPSTVSVARSMPPPRSNAAPSRRRASVAPARPKASGTLPHGSADLPAVTGAGRSAPPTAVFPN